MVTAGDMRQFSLECLDWAEQAHNPSDRQIIVRVAARWIATAAAIENKVVDDGILLPPDFRTMLD
jgi:hypothetical protein